MSDTLSLEDIASVLEMLSKFEVTEFKLERGEEKLWLKRGKAEAGRVELLSGSPVSLAPSPNQNVGAQILPFPVTDRRSSVDSSDASHSSGTASQLALSEPVKVKANLIDVVSPMVGTFYRRPAVDAEPYAKVGDIVKKGDVLCIVEAMKLMNEIETEQTGRIVEVCLEDGQMAEYGEVLFRLDPSI